MSASNERISSILMHELVECKIHGFHTDWMISGGCSFCRVCAREKSKGKWTKNHIKEMLYGASARGTTFDLDELFIESLLIKQNNCCALSGIKFSDEIKPSIDRVDSSLGYLRVNIQLVISEINYMKRNLSNELFIALCQAVAVRNP